MQDTAKYLIHADITADGVVERNDVVGAIFGQTEGLLGDDLDLRTLQDASKVGRIDVEIDSENGQSFGTVTIASGLDQVETAILAAALETIDRIGPCRARLAIDEIEDVRTAKRREVVERAKTLLAEAFEGQLSSSDIVAEVRRSVRVEDVTEYDGLPAGPRVTDSDAIVVVEGRADVLTLLEYGVKNAVAVEGTDVPDAVADLTDERTVTAFLDGDRGGELILRELAQIGDVDYVAIAPRGRSVEDLERAEVLRALREKVAYDAVAGADGLDEVAATDGSATPAPSDSEAASETADRAPQSGQEGDAGSGAESSRPDRPDGSAPDAEPPETPPSDPATGRQPPPAGDTQRHDRSNGDPSAVQDGQEGGDRHPSPSDDGSAPPTLHGHVAAVEGTGTVRLLDPDIRIIAEAPADEAFDRIRDADPVPTTVVLDGTLDQRVLDVAAQRGVGQVVTRTEGEYVKKPTDVRIRTIETVLEQPGD